MTKTPIPEQSWPADAVSRVPTASLIPYARNARTHSDAQVAQIAASIREWGWTIPVLVDEDGTLIAGHGRLLAAQVLGLPDVPVMVAKGWSEAKRRAYVIADNQLALNAGWDEAMLALEVSALDAEGFDLDLLGFDPDEIDDLLNGTEEGTEGLTDPDDVPEPLPEAISKPGDVWLLGKHRLMCGDSTDAAMVARLMGGEKANACISDPPYGIGHDLDYTRFTGGVADTRNKAKGVLANDDKPFNPQPFIDFDSVVLWGANCFSQQLPMGTWLVWDKRFSNGTAFLSDAEVAWMKGGHGVYIHAITSQGFIRPERVEHPTQKPVKLMAWCMEKAKAGNMLYEPFSGSGTTIIAAEQTNRRCYAMELSPLYVDVGVRRWQQFTGKTATLEATGEAFPA